MSRNHDDLRELVEEQLPRLAFGIMDSGPRWMYNAAHFGNRANWAHDEYNNWKRHDATGKLAYIRAEQWDSGPAYLYGGYDRPAPDPHINTWWYIAFYDIHLVDIDNIDPQPVEVDNSQVKVVELVKTSNNNASFRTVKTNKAQVATKEEDHSFGVTVGTEFELAVSRSAEASIGPVKGKQEMTAKFKAYMEARTDHAWRASDTLESSVEESYDILPFSQREITIKEGTPNIRQKIPTKGVLECKVRIDIRAANAQDFDSLDDLLQVWRGLRGGSEFYSAFFAGGRGVKDEVIDKWPRPRLNLDIEVRGERVRYFDLQDHGFAIPGKEREYEKAKREYYARR